jgi:tetratricopeptide (TPR) repeat protein
MEGVSVSAYLVKLARIMLAAGLFAVILLGGPRPSYGDERIEAAKRDYAEAEKALKEGHIAIAREALLSALKLVPRYSDAEFLLGVIEERSQRWQDAIDHYKKSLEIGPELAMHHYGIGVCQEMLGDLTAAKVSLEKAHDLAAKTVAEAGGEASIKQALAEIDYHLACVARDAGDDDECKKRIELGISEDPGTPRTLGAKLLSEKGALLLRTNDPAGAVKALEKALELLPDDLPSLYKLGRALVAGGREAEGKAKLERYEKLDAERRQKVNEQRRKDQAELLAGQAQAALKDGRKEEARALAKQAYGMDPSNTTAVSVLQATQ